jgi:hypothetical protein
MREGEGIYRWRGEKKLTSPVSCSLTKDIKYSKGAKLPVVFHYFPKKHTRIAVSSAFILRRGTLIIGMKLFS